MLVIAAAPARMTAEDPTPAAVAGFNSCISDVESQLARQQQSPRPAQLAARLRRGDLVIQQLTPAPSGDLPGALLHHWRGSAFIPGAKAADFVHLMQNYPAYPQYFSPQILRTKVLAQDLDHFQVSMRIRQRHVITVVLDTVYDITFAQLDPQRGYIISRSTRISEIDSPGTPSESALTSAQNHGYLWRLNTYWSYQEHSDGLYIQIESVSLTRSIPYGLGWAVAPYIQSIPRESLEFTLRSICNALRKQQRTLP